MAHRAAKSQFDFPFDETEIVAKDSTSTFVENLALPVHRWFRYSAGFSALWVRDLIAHQASLGRRRILDPFVGSGTVLLEAEACDCPAIGLESHPFVARVASAKLNWRLDPERLCEIGTAVLVRAREMGDKETKFPVLIQKCFHADALRHLAALKEAVHELNGRDPYVNLTWLALASILRECAYVGTAQWQYVLPNKHKVSVKDPFHAFRDRITLFSRDMAARQRRPWGETAILQQADARSCASVDTGWADLVITSPPYANNYDYADATRLEMSFFGEIKGWGDLQDSVRRHLIRSCTQHVAPLPDKVERIIGDPKLQPIANELAAVCSELDRVKEEHGGRKPYHKMIALYFSDLADVWSALRRVTATDSLVCFVVGDSAPYGIHVPVDEWLGRLAVSAGFRSYRFEKLRDRNTKWKNRKHRVPLHEGRLWVEG